MKSAFEHRFSDSRTFILDYNSASFVNSTSVLALKITYFNIITRKILC